MPLSPELAAQNNALEAQYRHDGRPFYTDSNQYVQPVHTDEEWQGIQQQKAAAAAAKQAAADAKAAAKAAAAQQKQQTGAAIDAARLSGRDFITSRVDGSPIYTESEEAQRAQQAAAAEVLRKKALTDQITKANALHDYETAQSSQRLLPATAVGKVQKSLKAAQQQAITALTGPVAQQAGQTNGMIFKEPTPEALKAQERLKALNAPDYQLTPEDLQALEADPATAKHAADIHRLQGMLDGHAAAEKAKTAHERKIASLALLRDDPAEFARQEAARRQSLSAADLGADLTASAEDLQSRQQQLQQQGQAIQQQLQSHELALSTLEQQAAQRRAQGIPAGELVPYQSADGTTEAWPKDLAQQREVLIAQQQAARLSLQPQIDSYEAARAQYEQLAQIHNDGVKVAQEKQQQAVKDTIAALRQNPGTEGAAQALEDLHAEHEGRLADLKAAYGDSPPQDQVQQLQHDLQTRQQSILDSVRKEAQGKEDDARAAGFVRRRTLRDTEEFMRLQQQDSPITAPVGSPEWKEQVRAQQQQASEFAAAKEAEHMRKAGLDPENPEHRTLIQDAEARDFSGVSKFEVPEGEPLKKDRSYSRTLSDGSVVVNPRFIQDATRYAQAVEMADATPEAKARAIADLPRLQLAHAAAMLPMLKAMPQTDIPGVPTFEKWQKATKPTGSEAEQARDYLQAMDKRGFWSKLTDTSIRGILAGMADVGTQSAGALAAVTGHKGLSEWAADTSQATQNFLAPLQAEGAHSSLAAEIAHQATRLAGPVASTLLITRGLGGGMGTASALSGVQTAGAQYADTYNQLRQEGLTHDQAWKRTAPWALGSGIASALITRAGGKLGAEAFLKSPAEIAKSAAGKEAQSLWKGMLSNIGKNAVGEVAEELPDELFSQISSYFATEKHPTHAGLGQVIGQFFAQSPAFLGSIMLMGGAGGAHEAWQEHKATTASQEAPAPTPTANLPETIAAAEDAIASYQAPEGTPPEVAQATQDAAHGVLSIAQGVPLTDLDADTLASLDIVQDPQKPGTFLNGRLVTGKDGVAEIQKYEAGQAVAEDGTSRPVRVRIQDGQPVISQSTLDNLGQLMPAVRAAIPLDERSRVQQLAAASSQPQKETRQPAQTPASTAPAPITTLPSREESASAAHQERAAQLATILESHGLDAAQALAAAAHVVASQGVVGSSAEEQYASGIDKEMAAAGWHRAPTEKAYTQRPAKLSDTQLAQQLQQRTGHTTVKALTEALQSQLGWTNYQRALTAATTALESTAAKGSVAKDTSATVKDSLTVAPRSRASIDPEAWVTAVRAAKAALPTPQRREGTRIIGLLEKHLFHYAGAFQKVQFATTPEEHAVSSAGGGMHVTPDGTLVLDLPRIAQQFAGLLEGPTRSQRADTALRAAVEEEVVHSVQLQLYGFDETAALFQSLPQALQAEVWRSYRVTDLAARAAVQLFQKSYTELTPEEKARADAAVVTGTPPKKWSPQHAAQLYFEFERMLVSDRVFAGRVSEAAAADPSFGKMLLDWLRNIIARLRNAISTAPQEVRTQIAQREAALVKALKTLQKSLGDSAGDALSQIKAKESKVDLQQDNRPSITTGSTSPAELPPLPFAPVLGAKGTAYTDANDAVEYQWAVVPVSSLNISNDDTGRINPSYPQELQPRDRTTAGSEAQVADIAKNMNLSRLSASSSVGDGAPIIGPDAVAESGNGRLMGMRRAWMSDSKAAQAYRSQLISTAASYGLNAEQVEAVPQPVLVRIRTTDLNRTAFVLSANVSTIAPKREIEQAKIDAKQIVPDIFEHFVPSEDGEIFTAANADFIRTFIATLIPPAERPAVIDAAGNLTQSGLRRIRNALFVYAYGPSPETLNALSRITESLESDTLRRLPDALVALAPRFAELNARQEAGALYPLSITSDLAWTLQKIQDLRNRGESVPDYLAQDRIPGIGDDPTPLQRQLLTYLSDNAARPRQIIATLSRYASAMDGAGDPRQASLFGDTRPTREELWALAATPREGALYTSTKSFTRLPHFEEGASIETIPWQSALDREKEYKAAGLESVDSGGHGRIWVQPDEAAWVHENGFGRTHLNTYALHFYQAAKFHLPQEMEKAARNLMDEMTEHLDESESEAKYQASRLREAAEKAAGEMGQEERGQLPGTAPSDAAIKSSDLGYPPVPPATALRLYRKLKKIEAEKGTLESTQAQTLERAERALGQMFLFDQPGLQDLRPAPFRLESEPLTPAAARQAAPPAQQLSLFTARKAADPRLAATFPDSEFDSYGFPVPPTPVTDPALLTPSIDKQTVTLEAGHPLVAAGMLPAGRSLPRRALHAALVRFFMGSARPVAPGEQPVIVAMAGGGGAGKSTILNALRSRGEFDISNAVQVNADDIKELIPEYETLRAMGDSRAAAIVHEESSHVSTLLMQRAMPDAGKGPFYNILFDGTLSNGPKSLTLIARWKATGYHVRIVGVTIDPKEAIIRAFLRARTSGRWVPLAVLAEAHNGFNEHIKEYSRVADSYNLFDNTPPEAHEIAQKTSTEAQLSIVNPQYWSIIDSRRYEPASQTPATGDSVESAGGQSSGESPGAAPLRQVQSPAQIPSSGSEDQVNLSASRKSLQDSGTPDLFSFNQGLDLGGLLTPAQKEAKLQQAQTLDLFGGSFDAQSRPSSQRPPRPARSSRPAQSAQEPGGFGELFAAPGMAGGSAGGAGPLLGDAPRLAGKPGIGGDSAVGGGAAIPPVGAAAGDAVEGADGSLSGVSGLPSDFDAHAFLRPAVGSPDRNFEVPASVQSLAPATDKAKILANVAAIRLLKELEGQNRNATPEEKQTLAAYTGWGAFKEAFNSKYEEDIAKYWDGLPEYRRQYMPEWLKSWEKNHRQLHKLLRENMTEDEFASASASTLNAHYTAAPIIRAMWKMVERLGFTGGRALEPSAGAGHYLGLQPESLADKTAWQTVELDDLSARLLSKLYPEATVNESPANYDRRVSGLGFERARIPNGSLDLAISNVPFHESGPRKKGFPTLNLHNFFFAHALDKVKPGGLVAFITSESTMQNNMRQREFIASKGDLVAAFRLPNNAFKGNAGTDVTTDIIILRKPDGTPFKGQPWRNLVEVGRQTITLTQGKDQTAEELRREAERTGEIVGKEYWKNGHRAFDVSAPIMVNEYFVAHPQHVLGQHTLASTMYRAGGYAVVAPDGLDVPAALDALIPSLPANVMQSSDAEAAQQAAPLASREDKPFSFKEQNGKIYEVQPDGSMEEAEWGTNPELVKVWRSWSRVSDAVEQLVAAESSDSATPESLESMRRALNIAYDTHVAAYKPISRRFSNQHRHLYSDPAYPLTAALENEVVTVDSKTSKKTYTYKKADIFTKRIGRPITPPKSAQSVDEALELSLAWQGRIDPAYAAALLGITPQQFTQQALQRPDVFENPSTSLLEQAEEYLTGNVRTKLEAAEAAAQDNPRFQKNVEALRAAQPERKEIARISPVLGSRWIPAPVYNAFIKEVLHGHDTVEYIPAGNTWLISGPGLYKSEDFGTENKSPAQLFKHALDMTEPLVYEGSGENRTFNAAASAAAKTAMDKMRRAFIDFVKTSDVPVIPTPLETTDATNESPAPMPVWQLVEDAFNESNNSYVTPRHTGTYLKFPGLNTDYVYTKAHRRAVIARFLNTRRGMMAHGVGSGKTFNQIILSKELRRLGLAKKPLIVVQNATLGQFAKSYLKAYPGARILVPTKADFEAGNRRKLVAKIATGSWDAVILPHSQFDLISNKPSAIKAYMDSQIDELMDIVTATKDKAKVRDLEGMIKRLKDRRQDMLDRLAARQDTAVMWEDLGIDALIMDEAQNYKSLPIITRMGRVKGVPASSNSQRAINFMLKCRDVQARTGGKNIFLATGTPIKNSMAEAYIMMQFMAPDILEEFHIHNFDDFATTYGQTVTEAEMAWGGTPKMETRFAKFQNGSSLVTMIRTMFDVAFGNEALGLDVPRIKGGEPEMRIIPATPAIDQFNAWTRSVNDAWKKADPKKKEEYTAVPIQTMAAGIAAALDPRLIAPTLPDDPQSKVNHAVRRALEIYKAGKARRTTQIIFSDLRNPFSMDYLMPFTGHPFPDYGSKGEFDLYKDIKAKLVAAGVPEAEVHLMQSGMTDVKKAALFEKVDAGEIRIIIGSTELLGVGVNIQTRLKAVHHLMPPRDFTPAMMEQRNGRIIRQGNLHAATVEGQPAWNEEVEVINYGTEGSMDSAIYGTLARKQRFITQLLMGENVQDTFDDPTDPVAVNMAEMAARTLGDPDFIRRITLEKEIKDLRLQAEAFTNEISGKRSRLARHESYIRSAPVSLQEAQQEAARLASIWQRTAPRPEGVKEETDISDKAVYEFGGQTIDTAAKDGAVTNKLDLHLLDVSTTAERRGQVKDHFTLTVNGHPLTVEAHLTIPGTPTGGEVLDSQGRKLFGFSGAASLIQNLRRAPSDAVWRVQNLQEQLQSAESSAAKLRAKLATIGTFPDAEKLAALEQEAREVDERLRAKAAPPEAAAPAAPSVTDTLPEMTPVDPKLMTPDVEAVIDGADILGNKLFLPDTLDRKLYQAVNKALESAGGRWNKKAQAHLFKGDPRPFLGLAPALSTSRKALDSAPENRDTPPHVTDPYTGAVSFITGPRLLREQGRQISHAHAQRLRAGLSSRRSTGPAAPALAADREGILNPGLEPEVPVLSAAQFARISALPKIGEGAEAAVHADNKAGVVYKVLNGYAPVPGLLGNPTLGVWPQLLHTADGKLDYHFAPAERPRQLAARLAVQTLMGGTPTEIAAIAPEGHIILKQPLSPQPGIGRDPDFIDNAGLSVARGRAGIVEVPSRLIADPNSPRVFLAVVEGRPWMLFDMHPDNFVGDHHGEARINDPIVAQVTADLVAKIPGLAQVIKDAAARAQQLGDRSDRLFTSTKSLDLSRAFAPTAPSKALQGLFKAELKSSAGGGDSQNFTAGTSQTQPKTTAGSPSLGSATANSRGAASYFPPTATPQLLLRAYAAATVGQSSQMLPIRRVFEEAQKIQPSLTPEAFLQAVKEGDDSGQVFLEPFDTPYQLTAAAPFVVRNAAGVPSVSMAVLPSVSPLSKSSVLTSSGQPSQTTANNSQQPQTAPPGPLARLGWNHLDRALSAKLAAHTRWLREPATTITKRTANNIAAHLVAMWSGKKDAAPLVSRLEAVGHSLKKELLPDSVLPREILAKKREMEIKTAMGSQHAMDLVRALSGSPKFSDIAYPKEFAENPVYRRNLYEAMAGERPLTSLPPQLQALATRLRSILVATGQEAVKQGRMSTETFDNLRTTYMPHFYKEDVQKEKSLFHKFRLGVRDILAQRTTAWHITDNEQKDSTGQPRLVSHSGNQWRFKSPEHMNAFYEDFITQQALGELRSRYGKKYRTLTAADLATPSKLDPEIRGRLQEIKRQLHARYTRHKPLTIAEQEKAGLIMDPVYAIARYAAQMAHDNATAEFFNAVAADPAHISDIATPGFTEIPDNPRFGRLAGKFVQADIASQVLEMIETPTVALQVYDTLLGWWKTGKTVLNPGTHVRNILGNLFFSQLAGASVWNPGNLTYYRQALAALRNGGADLTEAYEAGVLGADFVSAELRQTLRQLLPDPATIQEGSPEEQTRAARLIMGIGKAIGRFIGTPAGAVYDKAQTLYQAEDEVFKLAAYLKAKSMLGGDKAAAAQHVRQWFPYFDTGTSGTLKLLGRTAMPFLGFYRESVRIFGEALKHRPLALAASISLPSILTFLSAMALGLDNDDLDQVRKDMRGKAGKLLGPTPLEGMPLFSILLPTRSAEGALQQFDISAIHPFVDFLGDKVDIGHEEDWWQKTLRSFIAAGPLGSLLYSQMTGRDTFADRTFVEQNMTSGEKLAARADNLAKTLLPPLAPFGTGFTSLLHAGERSTNKTLTTRNTSQTIARSLLGLDVRSAQPDLYRLADDWRKAHGYEVQEGMDYGSTTPASRARSALFKELAQESPRIPAVKNLLKSLDRLGHPIRSEQDLNKLLSYKDPLKLIGGNRAKGITATDAQAQFRRSLHGEARQALESALTTYQEIKRKAPAILRQAQSMP